MASTYTTNLRLTKQGDGDNPNTWGQVLNDGVISLADDAIAGYTTVSIGSAATVTLTENQGTGDQSRSAILELKGSVGGSHSAINILIPNNSKTYLVRNSITYSSAGADVIMKVAGNTGVTVPTGGTSFVLTNGTSVITHNSFKNLVVDETVTVGGNAIFKTNVSVSGNVAVAGNVSVAGNVCASAFYGDGSNLTGGMPTGAIMPYAVTAAPSGYLLCDGAAVSRSTYSALFTVVSSLYGNGDGSSTFNVPDLRGRFMAGYNAATSRLTSVSSDMVDGALIANTGGIQAVTITEAQLPSHTHDSGNLHFVNGGDAAQQGVHAVQRSEANGVSVMILGSTGATGGGGVHSNIPPVIMVNYVIKH
jgi:microcystin-dependent protein